MVNGWKRYLDGLHPHLLAWIWAALLLVQVGLALEMTWKALREGLQRRSGRSIGSRL